MHLDNSQSSILLCIFQMSILMIKGRKDFAIYFPNVDLLTIKGKQFFVTFHVG
jgi:hypothetical protein